MTTKLERCTCPTCGVEWTVQKHDLPRIDAGYLYCPQCGDKLIGWAGMHFYTLAIGISLGPPSDTDAADDSL